MNLPSDAAPAKGATIYEQLERYAPDHLRRRPVMFLVSYKGYTYTAEWLSPGRWHVWQPEYLVIPPPPHLLTPEGDIKECDPKGDATRTPAIIEHYECCQCGYHIHRRSPPLGWRVNQTNSPQWLCPTCLDRLDTLTKERLDE